MLNGFTVENYKAFEMARMEIRPITLLLGANNIGKTSLLQFLMMLQQTALASAKYQSALKLYGGYLSLGQGKNIFRNFDMEKEVKFSLDFRDHSVASKLSGELIPEKLSDLWNFFRLTSHLLEDDESNLGDIRFVNRIYQHGLFGKELYELGDEFDETIDNLSSAAKRMRILWNQSDRGKRIPLKNLNPTYQNLDLRKEEVKDAFHFVLEIARKLRSEANFKVSFSIFHQNDSLQISEFSLSSGQEELIKIGFPNNRERKFNFTSSIKSSHFVQPKFLETLRHFFRQPKTIFAFIDKDPESVSDARVSIP